MNDNIGFLIADVSRHIRRAFDAEARAIGVTRPQWRVLTMLSRNEGISQGALADLLELEPMTLCRMVDRLAEAGLVERRPNPADRRAWRLHLTEGAQPLLTRLRGLADNLFADALGDIAQSRIEAMRDTLESIQSNLAARDEAQQEVRAHG